MVCENRRTKKYEELTTSEEVLSHISSLDEIKNIGRKQFYDSSCTDIEDDDVILICRHGSSPNLVFAPFLDWKRSNAQLDSVRKDSVACMEWKISEEGPKLSSHCLMIFGKR